LAGSAGPIHVSTPSWHGVLRGIRGTRSRWLFTRDAQLQARDRSARSRRSSRVHCMNHSWRPLGDGWFTASAATVFRLLPEWWRTATGIYMQNRQVCCLHE